jgi:hypothetical protein
MCCVIAVVLIWRGGGGKVRVDAVIVLCALHAVGMKTANPCCVGMVYNARGATDYLTESIVNWSQRFASRLLLRGIMMLQFV